VGSCGRKKELLSLEEGMLLLKVISLGVSKSFCSASMVSSPDLNHDLDPDRRRLCPGKLLIVRDEYPGYSSIQPQ